MKATVLVVLVGLAIVACGCVQTVSGRKTAGVPFVKDTIEARYPRPMEQVCQAAKEVIQQTGVLNYEGTDYGHTNAFNNVARVIEGKVSQRRVWVRVYQVDPRVTAVAVQTRTTGGGTDIELAAEIDKQIALKLVR